MPVLFYCFSHSWVTCLCSFIFFLSLSGTSVRMADVTRYVSNGARRRELQGVSSEKGGGGLRAAASSAEGAAAAASSSAAAAAAAAAAGSRNEQKTTVELASSTSLQKRTPPIIDATACLHGKYKPPGADTKNCVSRCDLEPSCDDVCQSIGKKCTESEDIVTSFLKTSNSCQQLLEQFPCNECEVGWGADLPSYRVWNYNFGKGTSMGKCFSRSIMNPHKFMCSGSYSNSHRLCPCVSMEVAAKSDLRDHKDGLCQHTVIDQFPIRAGSVRIRSQWIRKFKLFDQKIEWPAAAAAAAAAKVSSSTTKNDSLLSVQHHSKPKHVTTPRCQPLHLQFLFDTVGQVRFLF